MGMVKGNLPQLTHKEHRKFGEHVKVLKGLPKGRLIMIIIFFFLLLGEWELVQIEEQTPEKLGSNRRLLSYCWMLTACGALTGFCSCVACSIHHFVHVWMHKTSREGKKNPRVLSLLAIFRQELQVSVTISWVWQTAFFMYDLSSCIWDQPGQTNPKIKVDQMKGCFHSRCCHTSAKFLLW